MSSAITSCEHLDPVQRGDDVLNCHDDGQGRKKAGQARSSSSGQPIYSILDVPPWYLCILMGIQHFLTALGGLVAVPLILAKDLCLQHDPLTQSYLISTIFFVSGICTLLQVFLGVRLPILQGGTFAFVAPSLAMLSLPAWKCPEWTLNASLVNTSSPEFTEEWQKRIRELQGAIMVASCVQIVVGFSGLIGFLMRFIGPLTIAPTISLVALPLFDSAGNNAGIHWGIAAMTIFLIVLFSQYLKNIAVPMPVYGGEKKCHTSKFYLFQVFPVLLALCLSWLLCFVLTVTNTLPSAPTAYGHLARTDTKGNVLSQAPWFRFPYPGQWGLPTISLAGVFGIIAGVIASMVESVGDYYACARLVGAPPPPRHAVNRGIGIEGLGCLLAGAWGSGNGTTSYSENVGALGITREAWRREASWCGIKSRRSLRRLRWPWRCTASPVGSAPSAARPPAPSTSPSGPSRKPGRVSRDRACSPASSRSPQESAGRVPQKPSYENCPHACPKALCTPRHACSSPRARMPGPPQRWQPN
ncbi:solute carrier family 23 member 2 isoform X4 [Ursus maritimus]|uniref:Solute carrier family 23 member 2 isoform X4 n=1 Tax=Ursus maritimus TaxID=29073 RepID=A0A8M1GVZ8_URSMA|nr:solute carrier family 23 member 2 isoform X4 [Ursus maritimus]